MSDYILSCCSTADLAKEHFNRRDIHYICFHYELGGVQYADDLGESVSFEDFYRAMAEGADTKTSQINASEFEAYWEPFLQEGKDILHISLSSGISGVYNSANIAKEIMLEKYPDRKIYVVDSLGASSGYGFLVDKLADLRDEGMGIDELRDWAEANRMKVQTWFFSSDLTFFIKGGRVSKASGLVGGLLNICPLMEMDREGHLTPRYKIRTKRRVISAAVDKMVENAENGLEYSGKCYMSHSACLEDCQVVAKLIEERFPKLDGKVLINNVGTTIGSHTGPGTVALFYWGKERE